MEKQRAKEALKNALVNPKTLTTIKKIKPEVKPSKTTLTKTVEKTFNLKLAVENFSELNESDEEFLDLEKNEEKIEKEFHFFLMRLTSQIQTFGPNSIKKRIFKILENGNHQFDVLFIPRTENLKKL